MSTSVLYLHIQGTVTHLCLIPHRYHKTQHAPSDLVTFRLFPSCGPISGAAEHTPSSLLVQMEDGELHQALSLLISRIHSILLILPPKSPSRPSSSSMLTATASVQSSCFAPSCCNHSPPHGGPTLSPPRSTLLSAATRLVFP